MNKKIVRICVLGTAVSMTLSLLAGCTSKSNADTSPDVSSPEVTVSPSPAETTQSPAPTQVVTKESIDSSLKAEGDKVFDITWSPDGTSVAFIRDEAQTGNIYVWKTSEETASLVSVANPTTDGFLWSPNSEYFLINVGHMGPGLITSTLIATSSLEVISADISSVSVSPPVWSYDSRFLLLSSYADDGTAEITAFAVASETTASLVKSVNTYGPFIVESWGTDNLVRYTEMTDTDTRVEKTIEVGE